MTYTVTDIATAIDELQALVALIERPPLDDVKLSQSVALRTAGHIRTLIAAAPAETVKRPIDQCENAA